MDEDKLKNNSRLLRKSQTNIEKTIWTHLRGRKFLGHKFRRQKVFGHYIVDFVCLEKKIIIELDGGQHMEALDYDESRTLFLNSLGYQVLRFWNNDVLSNLDMVLDQIYRALNETIRNLPSPAFGTLSRQRERDQKNTPTP